MRLKQAVLALCFCAAVSGQSGIPSRMTIQKAPISRSGMRSDAQTTQRGAEVRAVHFAPDNKSATVDIVNSSSKDISAYGVSYDITFADGHHEKGERLVEYLQSIISSQQRLGSQWSGEGVFHSGESRKELFEFSQGNAVSTLNATVDVVIYMDQTADVGNDDAFRMFVTDRTATAKAAEKAATILQTALADQTDLHPLKTASMQLHQMMVNEPPKSLPARADIEGLIRNMAAIQASGRSDERESMKACLAEKNQQKVTTLQHAQIRGPK
ncbi:MAG TPA: hypothetical protein VFQ41_19620 [Candidatus Angelobacter sp.]|nr:hypothetical protein [Candidatus Angelobacter sp.]